MGKVIGGHSSLRGGPSPCPLSPVIPASADNPNEPARGALGSGGAGPPPVAALACGSPRDQWPYGWGPGRQTSACVVSTVGNLSVQRSFTGGAVGRTVHVRTSVCVCVRVHTCDCVSVHECTRMSVCPSCAHACVSMWISVHACLCVHVQLWVSLYLRGCMYTCICMYFRVCVCVHMWLCASGGISVCVHVCVYLPRRGQSSVRAASELERSSRPDLALVLRVPLLLYSLPR